MAYSKEQKEEIFEKIFSIIENGESLRKALISVSISSKTFYEWLEADEEKIKQYARATEERAEALLDEMLDIVDDNQNDTTVNLITGVEMVNHENIQRSRLRYDARKWLVSKLNPKKYGNTIDVTSGGEKVNNAIPIVMEDGRTYEDLKNELNPE